MNSILSRSLNTACQGLLIAFLATRATGDVVFEPPRAIRVVSVENVPLSVLADRIDRSGIHGNEGLVPWETIRAREASRLWLAVMDRQRAGDWLDAAWILLIHPMPTQEDERMAKRFMREASRRLPDGPAQVEALMVAAAAHIAKREAENELQHAEWLRRLGPEAQPWPVQRWPLEDFQSEERRSRDLRAWLMERLNDLGHGAGEDSQADGRLKKCRHALLTSDEPRRDLMDIGLQVDALVTELNQVFDQPRGSQVFGPRAAILVCSQPDNHERIVGDVFDRPLEPVLFQPIGPDDSGVVLCLDGSDIKSVMPALRHTLVHAWMHRYRSPRRPPPWFNEGLAHAMAWWRESPSNQPWRSAAVKRLRTPGAAEALLQQPYAPGHWSLDGVDTAAAGLLVRRFLEERREEILNWIERIKRGEDADEAFVESMGASPSEVIARYVRYWTLND
ncbi:MAG: hypothetical protein VX527_00130 [Planctomycetota bacterium]|nr:hypothetical protein [Planctomycetota bacterium]